LLPYYRVLTRTVIRISAHIKIFGNRQLIVLVQFGMYNLHIVPQVGLDIHR